MIKLKAVFLFVVLSMFFIGTSFAQCAMCRATLETNVSNGSETNMAATLNIGILYLFMAPYLLVATIGFIWYRQSKASANIKK